MQMQKMQQMRFERRERHLPSRRRRDGWACKAEAMSSGYSHCSVCNGKGHDAVECLHREQVLPGWRNRSLSSTGVFFDHHLQMAYAFAQQSVAHKRWFVQTFSEDSSKTTSSASNEMKAACNTCGPPRSQSSSSLEDLIRACKDADKSRAA
jgi:hypothetical protein